MRGIVKKNIKRTINQKSWTYHQLRMTLYQFPDLGAAIQVLKVTWNLCRIFELKQRKLQIGDNATDGDLPITQSTYGQELTMLRERRCS